MEKPIFTKSLQKVLLIFTLVFLIAESGFSQKSKVQFDLGADMMSRYVWRGMDIGNSPSIQPGMTLNWKGLEAGFWGAYSTQMLNVQEMDFYLSYSFNDYLSVMVTDYFFPDYAVDSNNYFEFGKDETGHVVEGAVTVSGGEKLPLSLMAAVNFYGNDARNSDGDIFYSTYFELKYEFNADEKNFSAFLGFSPNDADEDKEESGFYGNDPGIVNLGITMEKELKITEKYALPLSASVICNPQKQNVFLVFGFSL